MTSARRDDNAPPIFTARQLGVILAIVTVGGAGASAIPRAISPPAAPHVVDVGRLERAVERLEGLAGAVGTDVAVLRDRVARVEKDVQDCQLEAAEHHHRRP